MAKIGNNSSRNVERPTRKEMNDAWNAVRKRGIERTINLNNQLSTAIFSASTSLVQQQASNALQGSNVSMASAMSRLNILV
jgi:hypothetical protein